MKIADARLCGLTEVGRTNDTIIYQGGKENCLKMATALGLKVVKYEGRTIGFSGRYATQESANASEWAWCWLSRGMICKAQQEYVLVVPNCI